MEPFKGKGRGQALMQVFKIKSPDATPSPPPSSEDSASPTPAPSTTGVSVSSAMAGRGRLAMMMGKMQPKPGGVEPPVGPASDVSLSQGPPKGAGRGLKILESLAKSRALTQKSEQLDTATPSEVSAVTQGMSQLSTSASTVAKNKYFKEVKDTPPVVMKGESGTPCDVTANFIYLNFSENNVFEYDVKYEPDQDHKTLRFKLLNEHADLIKTKTFDGTTLYVPHRLSDDALNLVSTNPYDESKVKITITYRRPRRLSEMIHIYNILFKQIMKDLKLVRFNRQHFNEHAAIQIPQHNLEVWPGYVTAVDEYEGGLMLTLDSTHRVLRTQSVLSLIRETVQRSGANWKRDITEILVGSSVMTTYNKKLFRIDCIDDTMNPRSTFERNEGGTMVQISYVDYYKKNYGINIVDWEQPMLISRDTRRMPGNDKPTEFMMCLVPELCQLTGLTQNQRNNFTLMKDVATYTRITPNQRHSAFKKYIQSVMNNESARKRLEGWGLSIAPETINLTARTLPPEALFFGNNIKIPGKPKADWNMEATRHPVMTAMDVCRWVVLYTNRDQRCTQEFVDTMLKCSQPMGINVSRPELILLPSDRTDAYVNQLRKLPIQQLQLVVAICPTARDDRYAAIKKICCADRPVPSQVINSRTIMNSAKLRSITQKILLQINCKLGGTLWHINIPFKSTMIIGIDSYHDAGRKHRSVLAFVASYNQSMTQWYSRAVFQEQGQEIVDSLKSCLLDSLRHFLNINGFLPDRIIMYRDGVGDGQLKVVRDYEIPQMKVCFTTMNEKYTPSLTYVVVQKRINTRIFQIVGGGYDNPMPGTVVDHGITRRDWYDFLIVSQKVGQGTVTPTHYVVLHDSSGFTPDQSQRLTYKMCHLYYNWPGTVRVPAPCQYAHKLASLVGQSMHQLPALELSDKLFFL